ncbi:hypothetical protein QTP88_025646 [Uroleucon formosanum]
MNNKEKLPSGYQKRVRKRQIDLKNAANNSKKTKLSFSCVLNQNKPSSIQPNNIEIHHTTSISINNIEATKVDYTTDSQSNQLILKQENIEMETSLQCTDINDDIDNTHTNINELSNDLYDDCDDNESNMGVNSDIMNTGYFISPSNMPTNVKIDFVNNHPIQPTGPLIFFDPSKTYYRSIENKDNREVIQRKWLSYNVSNNNMYCSICMAFATNRSVNWVTGIPVNVKHIYKSVEIHEISKNHKLAVDAYLVACSSKSLDLYFNDKKKKILKLDDKFLKELFLCYSFQDSSSKIGNFLAIVKLVAKFDPVLKNFIEINSKKSLILKQNADTKNIKGPRGRGSFNSFLSKNTFNKIIIIIGNLIKKKIADEVINAKIFSLEIDSTQDVSVMDQLLLCIRYVYKGEIQERFLNMLEVKSSTGEEQYKLVKKSLESLSIDLKNLISESLDGAANMSGQYSGLQAHLKKDSPKSIFTHCHAHVLNLIIGDITNCCIPSQNLFEYCQQTTVFVSRSYKRTNLWRNILQEKNGSEKLRKLKKIGETRWNSKDIALQAIFHSVTEENNKRDRYLCLLELLHTIGFDGIADGGTAAEARNLLEKWTSFEIILTAFTYIHIFSKATPVSKYLQTKCLDYLAAWNQIVSFGNEIKNMSNEFDKIYEQAKNFTEIMEIKTEKFANIFIETSLPEKRKYKKKENV